jgi:hypothetical protein
MTARVGNRSGIGNSELPEAGCSEICRVGRTGPGGLEVCQCLPCGRRRFVALPRDTLQLHGFGAAGLVDGVHKRHA